MGDTLAREKSGEGRCAKKPVETEVKSDVPDPFNSQLPDSTKAWDLDSYKSVGMVIRDVIELTEQRYDSKKVFPVALEELNFLKYRNHSGVSEKILERLAPRQSNSSEVPLFKKTGEVIFVVGNSINITCAICEVILKLIYSEDFIAIYSLKWEIETLVLKLIAMEGRINGERLITGELSEKDWSKITCTAGLLGEAQFYLVGFPALGLDEIVGQTIIFKKEAPRLKLLVIDSLQLLSKGISEPLSDHIKRMRLLSEDLKLPIILTIASYNDEIELF